MITDIADKMMDTITFAFKLNPLPDVDRHAWREKIVKSLWPAYDRMGEVFLNNELIADLCLGPESKMFSLIETYPVLRPVKELLDEYYNETLEYQLSDVDDKMDTADQDAYDKWVKDANVNIDEYIPKEIEES